MGTTAPKYPLTTEQAVTFKADVYPIWVVYSNCLFDTILIAAFIKQITK